MINAVRGKAIEITDSSIVVLTDGGVEYFLEVTINTANYYRNMSTEERKSVRVLTVLQHREDAMTLFGFYDDRERFCFNELQTVPGIGPKGALKILSGITVNDLILALDQQDVKKLSKVPGLGAKTAQKLILQLRNVLVLEDETTEKEDKSSGKISSRFGDLISSFTEMGYDRKTVIKAIEGVLEDQGKAMEGLSDRDIEKKIFTHVLRRLN
ncbi:MAG: Holliday junction branch migration protein RuvA [Spirochaetales bacterium]|nr:Holliday junction branch migration protein RuvA [Candidatus Physcosoma equi]